MYDTLIMLKPDAAFTPDGLYELVAGVVASGGAQLSREGKGVRIANGDSWIEIAWNPSTYVREESDEKEVEGEIPWIDRDPGGDVDEVDDEDECLFSGGGSSLNDILKLSSSKNFWSSSMYRTEER